MWLFGVGAEAAQAAGFTVVASPAQARTSAIVRVATPFETLHPDYFFGAIQHEGRLDFRDGDAGYEGDQAGRA